jgi:hypothetical protein
VQGLTIRMKTSDEDERQEAKTVKEPAVRTVPIDDEDIALNLARRRGDIESYR